MKIVHIYWKFESLWLVCNPSTFKLIDDRIDLKFKGTDVFICSVKHYNRYIAPMRDYD